MKLNFLILRNSIVLFTLLSVSMFPVVAQEQKTSTDATLTPKIGVKGGVNFTNMYVDDVKDENMKVGFNLGLFAKLPVTRGLSIQPEIIYSVKGSKITYDFGSVLGVREYRYNFNYVEVPVLAVINVAKNFNVHAGAYAAYLAQANIKREQEGPNDEITNFNEDDFNRFDYGLVGGLGIDVESITIGARYNYGLKEVGKSGSLPSTSDALKNSKNSVISLYIGFGF